MNEKQPVVIQGRTIHRERSKKQGETDLFSYLDPIGSLRDPGNNEPEILQPVSSFPDSGAESYRTSSDRSLYRNRYGDRPRQRRSVRPRTALSSSDSILTNPRISSAPRPRSGSAIQEEDVPSGNKLLIQIAVSALLAFLVFLMNSIPMPFTQSAVGYVKTVLSEDFKFDDAIGKLKFVSGILPDQIKEVFGSLTEEPDQKNIAFGSPANGEVYRTFGEKVIIQDTGKYYTNQGIDIKISENDAIYASAPGVVAVMEEHSVYGPSVWIDHGNRIFTFYGGCIGEGIKEGQSVGKGQKLGVADRAQAVFHFQIWIDNKPVDPLEHINKTLPISGGEGV